MNTNIQESQFPQEQQPQVDLSQKIFLENQLPTELYLHIFNFLEKIDVESFSGSSKLSSHIIFKIKKEELDSRMFDTVMILTNAIKDSYQTQAEKLLQVIAAQKILNFVNLADVKASKKELRSKVATILKELGKKELENLKELEVKNEKINKDIVEMIELAQVYQEMEGFDKLLDPIERENAVTKIISGLNKNAQEENALAFAKALPVEEKDKAISLLMEENFYIHESYEKLELLLNRLDHLESLELTLDRTFTLVFNELTESEQNQKAVDVINLFLSEEKMKNLPIEERLEKKAKRGYYFGQVIEKLLKDNQLETGIQLAEKIIDEIEEERKVALNKEKQKQTEGMHLDRRRNSSQTTEEEKQTVFEQLNEIDNDLNNLNSVLEYSESVLGDLSVLKEALYAKLAEQT